MNLGEHTTIRHKAGSSSTRPKTETPRLRSGLWRNCLADLNMRFVTALGKHRVILA